MSEEYLLGLVSKLPEFSLFLAILAPFVGGEIAIITIAFFSGQGLFPLWHVIIGSFLGMILLDSFWFVVPNSRLANKLKNWGRSFDQYRNIEARIESISGKNDIIILLISKILVGTRILVLTYLGLRKISFGKFILYNSVATIIWAIILAYTGWLAGLGYYTMNSVYNTFTFATLFVGIIIGLFYTVLFLIRKWIEKKK